MGDILAGLAVMLGLAVGMFCLGYKIAQRVSPLVAKLLSACTIVAAALCVMFLRESVFLARLLPFSNLIVLSNWLPLAAGLLAGLVWHLTQKAKRPRRWPVVILAVLGAYSATRFDVEVFSCSFDELRRLTPGHLILKASLRTVGYFSVELDRAMLGRSLSDPS